METSLRCFPSTTVLYHPILLRTETNKPPGRSSNAAKFSEVFQHVVLFLLQYLTSVPQWSWGEKRDHDHRFDTAKDSRPIAELERETECQQIWNSASFTIMCIQFCRVQCRLLMYVLLSSNMLQLAQDYGHVWNSWAIFRRRLDLYRKPKILIVLVLLNCYHEC